MIESSMTGKTQDITAYNIAALKRLFPEIVCENEIDFDKLQVLLGKEIASGSEKYSFSWAGKTQSLRLSQTPSTGSLRPSKEESKNWDSTGNAYIEGDNLEVLKLLQKAYHGKIKLIYIDPPYNTGSDFVYPDDYKDNIQNYLEITRQVNEEGKKTSTNSEVSGRYHTNWLNMMYPRLRLARNLLTEDGAIFISIDDNEEMDLRRMCNEIYGEDNFVACFVWQKRTSPDARLAISCGHEYILLYSKNLEAMKASVNLLPLTQEQKASYKNPDNDPRGPWTSTDFTAQIGHATPQQFYTITAPNGVKYTPPQGTCWKNIEPVFLQKLAEGRFWFGKEGNSFPRRKTYLSESMGRTIWTWWTNKEVGHTQEATKELKDLLGVGVVFDSPKPIKLILRMIQLLTKEDSIVLDFFSGSATTAHAVMQLNSEDNYNRKFIMVQLPELCSEDSEAAKAGYKNICEIGKERIRRAGGKIVSELKDKYRSQTSLFENEGTEVNPEKLDIGFKVFKLDSSNLKKWNPDNQDIENSLEDMVHNYISGRSELDVVYEIMLKYGIDLMLPISEIIIEGCKVYSIGFGALVICLDNRITTDIASGIVNLKSELKPEVMRVVVKDTGFEDDSVKTNVKEILKYAGIEEFITV